MTPFQAFIFFSKNNAKQEKGFWYFPDNTVTTINSFVIGTNLDRVIINWGDGNKAIAKSYEKVNHTY